MSTSLVIVAIPEETDRVWKVSSQEVPHLTLLYLGDDVSKVQNLDQIMQFVEHAVTLSEHGPFYLDVDHRGTLGDAEADVLFFNKRSWNLKWIRQFRGQLLQNQAVRTAFDSAEQILEAPQEWAPHLTLGYPDTPAKELPDNGFDHPLYSVCFDRIAVWAEEFNGPEFRLEWPDRELEGDLAVAYSDEQKKSLMHDVHNGQLQVAEPTTQERGDEFILEHFGIKGMKWGVRNAANKAKSGAKAVGRGLSRAADALGEHFYETSPHSSVTQIAIHNQVADEIDSKIHLLQSAPKYRGKNLKADRGLETEYHQDVAKVTDSAYKRAVKDHIGENTKGTKEATYVNDARGARIEIRHKGSGEKITEAELGDLHNIQTDGLDGTTSGAGSGTSKFKHADIVIPLPDITIPLKLDDNGQIKAIGRLRAQEPTTIDHGAAFAEGLKHGGLLHYGIKGMHWGQTTGGSTGGFRRSAPQAVTPHAESKVPHGKRRKTKVEVDGGENHPASEDAIKVAEAHAKLVKSGPKALSNKELRDVAQRVQLEQQAIQATRPSASKWVRSLLKNQGNQVVNAKIQSKVNPQTKKK